MALGCKSYHKAFSTLRQTPVFGSQVCGQAGAAWPTATARRCFKARPGHGARAVLASAFFGAGTASCGSAGSWEAPGAPAQERNGAAGVPGSLRGRGKQRLPGLQRRSLCPPGGGRLRQPLSRSRAALCSRTQPPSGREAGRSSARAGGGPSTAPTCRRLEAAAPPGLRLHGAALLAPPSRAEQHAAAPRGKGGRQRRQGAPSYPSVLSVRCLVVPAASPPPSAPPSFLAIPLFFPSLHVLCVLFLLLFLLSSSSPPPPHFFFFFWTLFL